MSAVNTAIHGLACYVSRGLCDCVVTVAKLELHDVPHGSDDRVGHKGVLWAANDNRDNLIGAAVGTGFESVLVGLFVLEE
jgi:hypothetical protein